LLPFYCLNQNEITAPSTAQRTIDITSCIDILSDSLTHHTTMTDYYGRPLRGTGPAQDGYFDDASMYYAAESRDRPSLRRADSSSTPRRSPTTNHDKITSAPAPENPAASDGVSPEIIAAITKKVKEERT
jgi:hypothetical protein